MCWQGDGEWVVDKSEEGGGEKCPHVARAASSAALPRERVAAGALTQTTCSQKDRLCLLVLLVETLLAMSQYGTLARLSFVQACVWHTCCSHTNRQRLYHRYAVFHPTNRRRPTSFQCLPPDDDAAPRVGGAYLTADLSATDLAHTEAPPKGQTQHKQHGAARPFGGLHPARSDRRLSRRCAAAKTDGMLMWQVLMVGRLWPNTHGAGRGTGT